MASTGPSGSKSPSPNLQQLEINDARARLAKIADGSLQLPPAPLQVIPVPVHPTPSDQPVSVTFHDDAHDDSRPSLGASLDDARFRRIFLPGPVDVEVPKAVIEYPLPGAWQTHEMTMVGESMLVIAQQSNSTFVKVTLSASTGRPVSCTRFLLDDFWAGLHCVCVSQAYENQIWASLQFKNALLRIKPGVEVDSTPSVREIIALPAKVSGPHCVCECGSDLWVTCKDSRHVVRLAFKNPSSNYDIYDCGDRPILIARHPLSFDMYCSLDCSTKIWRFDRSSKQSMELEIPVEHGTTPVGLVPGTDGNVWFTMLGDHSGGTGTFGRILHSGVIQWFKLTTPVATSAGLIHLAFDWNEHFNRYDKGDLDNNLHRVWLLSSTLIADPGKSIDAVFSVIVDVDRCIITTQQSIALPTQRCATHRVIPHRTGLFVSQLKVASVAHITGSAALSVEVVPGETTDVYSIHGLGQPHQSYVYKLEVPEKQRTPIRLPPCPLTGHFTYLLRLNKPEMPSGMNNPSTQLDTKNKCSSKKPR